MCRHLAWLGESRTLADLVLDPPHSLLVQSWAPRRQRHGRLNADGWGVGLHTAAPDGEPQTVRWRSERPLWSDASFASVARVLAAGSVLAAVRSATEGMPVEQSATAPFRSGRWLLSHNGRVERSALPPAPRAESSCDSALLAALVFDRGPERLGETVREVAGRDPGARLNLLCSDGERVLATTWGDTLSVLVTGRGVAVASEPYDDDPGWDDVPDRHLLEVTRCGLTLTPLE